MSSTEEKKDIDVSDITDFDSLLNLVRADANLVDNLTDEQVTELRKKLNPYGRTIEGSGKYTCISITNLSEQYRKRFLMTALIGFLYRQVDEYCVDDGEQPCPMDNYEEFMKRYTESEKKALESKKWLYEFNKATEKTDEKDLSIKQKALRLENIKNIERGEGFKKRLIVRQFIDSLFKFNPDVHVRSSYSDNPLDPERVRPSTVSKKSQDSEKAESTVPPEEAKIRANSMHVKHIPPSDTFHRLDYYIDSNYEEIRNAVTDLYSEKPDLEFAINPYEQFDNLDDAERYVQKHKDEIITDVLTLTNGKWNLCGSFKKNRERVNFYNEKTAVIEEIFKQIEVDKKLGADMMRKRVKRKKKQNIKESGADPKEFSQYKKDFPSAVEQMGAENVSRDYKEPSTKETFKVHEECPYDAIQVDVFDFRKGGQSVKKSEFFTQAEKPEKPELAKEQKN